MSISKRSNSITVSKTVIGGKSAYEIAVENGFVGTEEEWLESLKASGRETITYRYGVASSDNVWNEDTIIADIGTNVNETWRYGLFVWKQAFINNLSTGTVQPYGNPAYDEEQQSALMSILRFDVLPDRTTYAINRRKVGDEWYTEINLSRVIDIGYRCDRIEYECEYTVVNDIIRVPNSSAPAYFLLTAYGSRYGQRIERTRNTITFVGVDETVYNTYFGALDTRPSEVALNGDSYYDKTNGAVMLYENGWIEASESTDPTKKVDAYSKAQRDVLSEELSYVDKSAKTVAYYGYFDHVIANTVNAEYVNAMTLWHDYEEDEEGYPTKGYKIDGNEGEIKSYGSKFTDAKIRDATIDGDSTFFGDLAIKDSTGLTDLIATHKSDDTYEEVKVEKDSVQYFSLGDIANDTSLNLIKSTTNPNVIVPLSPRKFEGTERLGNEVSWEYDGVLLSNKTTYGLTITDGASFALPYRANVVSIANMNVPSGVYEAGTILRSSKTSWNYKDLTTSNGYTYGTPVYISKTIKGTYGSGNYWEYNKVGTFDNEDVYGVIATDNVGVTHTTKYTDVHWAGTVTNQVGTGSNIIITESGTLKLDISSPATCKLDVFKVNGTTIVSSYTIKQGSAGSWYRNVAKGDRIYIEITYDQGSGLDFTIEVYDSLRNKFGITSEGLWLKKGKDSDWTKISSGNITNNLTVGSFSTRNLMDARCEYSIAFDTGTVVLMNGNQVVKTITKSSTEWYTSELDIGAVNSSQAQVRKGYKATEFSSAKGSASQFDSDVGVIASWTKISPVLENMVGNVAFATWTPPYYVSFTDTNGVIKSISKDDLFSGDPEEVIIKFKGISQGKGITVQNINPETTGSYDIGSNKYPFNNVHSNNFYGDLKGNADTAGYAGSAGSVSWDNVSGKPNPFPIREWWTYGDNSKNANNLVNGIVFAYNANHGTPATGTLVSFANGNGNYQLQIQGYYNYHNQLWFRNMNGDNGQWNAWKRVITEDEIGNYIKFQ